MRSSSTSSPLQQFIASRLSRSPLFDAGIVDRSASAALHSTGFRPEYRISRNLLKGYGLFSPDSGHLAATPKPVTRHALAACLSVLHQSSVSCPRRARPPLSGAGRFFSSTPVGDRQSQTMGWYKGSKLALDKLRYAAIGSKRIARNPFQPPVSGKASQLSDQWKVGSSSSLLSSRFGHLGGLRENPKTQLFNAGRRYYHVDRYQVSHFRPRGFKKWFENPRNMLIVVLLSSGVVITVYFGNLETIPYTKRTHFVLLSRDLERQLGESQFKQIKAQYKGKLLPAIHPDSVRVRLIAKDVIEALQRGTRHEQVWSDPSYAFEEPESQQKYGSHDPFKALGGGKDLKMEGDWRKEEEFLDDKWVKDSRKKGEARGAQPATQHLDHVNWEVAVVDDPLVNAFCLPGGKIVVFTGLLKHFRSDAEIATIIGHEVGHAVARHVAEQITKNMWLAIVQLILYQFVMPDVVNTMSTLFLRLPFSRKMEIEADYIGLLLTASAGYDPRVAPTVYEKLGKIAGGSALEDYLSTHPSGKKRAQLLVQAQVMQEAMAVYRERISGRGVEGFL